MIQAYSITSVIELRIYVLKFGKSLKWIESVNEIVFVSVQ